MGDRFGGRLGNFGGSFGGFRGSSLFGGRGPFDDPFFSRPFEDLLEPNTFNSGPSFSSNSQDNNNGGKSLIVEELPSDEEVEEKKDILSDEDEHSRLSNQPSVEHPDDDSDGERKIRNVNQQRSYFGGREGTQSRVNTFRHHTSKVTYGGIDGAYYTSTRTRRARNDGIVVEESKEADKTTGEATHRISRGIKDKGHSVTRKLNSGGGVESTRILHNLDEDELSGFEEAWKGNSFLDKHESTGFDHSFGRWLLPSMDQTRRGTDQIRTGPSTSSTRAKKVVRINIE